MLTSDNRTKVKIYFFGLVFLLNVLSCMFTLQSHVCAKCGNLHSPLYRRPTSENAVLSSHGEKEWTCQLCGESGHIKKIYVPYVFKYLTAELTAMNIRTVLKIK